MVNKLKKILMRSGMTPFDNFDPSRVIVNNSIGGNCGNLVYACSIFRALMTKNTEIDSTRYRLDYTKREIEKINENYSYFVIPLADAFREGFENYLIALTRMIKLLKIPAIVIGVGLCAPFEPNLSKGFPFDDVVKAFMDAVLEKSAIVGVRGQITADYLSSLGYIEGIHHMVIGCPSMYMYGCDLKIRDTKITKDSLVCINNSVISPMNVLRFIDKSGREFSNGYFIPQRLNELKLTYLGIPIKINPDKINCYPNDINHYLYQKDRVRFFINFREWSKFISNADFTFGARVHGNIISVISGTPSLMIPKDARMRELAEYHNLTRVNYTNINNDTSIWDLIERADFKAPEKNQKSNFGNYLKFLKINELESVFDNDSNPIDTPFDIRFKDVELQPAVITYNLCSGNERIMRTNEYVKRSSKAIKKLSENLTKQKELNNMLRERIAGKNKLIDDKNKTISEMKRIVADKDKIINLRSVRFIVKARKITKKLIGRK